ncbi:MAG: glycerol kinase GlpK [Chlamydiota bacterium]
MNYVLAMDQGTTSCRSIIFDENGSPICVFQKKIQQFFPKPGFIEQDPLEIINTQVTTAQEAIKVVGLNKVKAIGIANQRETTILWNKKTGKPLMNAIVWQDRRTHSICKSLKSHESLIHEKTGLLLDPYFSATKIKWILDNYKIENIQDIAFGTIDSWLVWNLTGNHLTDVSNASRTLLFNIHTLSWDEELCQLFNIPKEILPKVVDSTAFFGNTKEGFFTPSLPIQAVIGDQQGALIGQGCLEKGTSKCTYGTGCFFLMNTGNKPFISQTKLLTTIAWKHKEDVFYAIEATVFNAGSVIEWLKNNLEILKETKAIDEIAGEVTDTHGVTFVPAFTGLTAPYWEPNVEGLICNITRGVTKFHICRAALEAIAMQVNDVLQCVDDDTKIKNEELKVDGGLCSSDLLMQLQSDFSHVKIVRNSSRELTALGAATLAFVGIGVLKNITAFVKTNKIFIPQMAEEKRKAKIQSWQEAVNLARTKAKNEPK